MHHHTIEGSGLFSSDNPQLNEWSTSYTEEANDLLKEVDELVRQFADEAVLLDRTNRDWYVKLLRIYGSYGRKLAEKHFGSFDHKDKEEKRHLELFSYLGNQMTKIIQNIGG